MLSSSTLCNGVEIGRPGLSKNLSYKCVPNVIHLFRKLPCFRKIKKAQKQKPFMEPRGRNLQPASVVFRGISATRFASFLLLNRQSGTFRNFLSIKYAKLSGIADKKFCCQNCQNIAGFFCSDRAKNSQIWSLCRELKKPLAVDVEPK